MNKNFTPNLKQLEEIRALRAKLERRANWIDKELDTLDRPDKLFPRLLDSYRNHVKSITELHRGALNILKNGICLVLSSPFKRFLNSRTHMEAIGTWCTEDNLT